MDSIFYLILKVNSIQYTPGGIYSYKVEVTFSTYLFLNLLPVISVLDNIYLSKFIRLMNLSRQTQDSESLFLFYTNFQYHSTY